MFNFTKTAILENIKLSESESILIDKIKSTAEKLGVTVYLAGGFVRDRLLGKENDDIDFVTDKGSERLAQALAEQYSLSDPIKMDKSGATMVYMDDKHLDFIDAEKVFSPITDTSTLEEGQEAELSIFLDDAYRRDLTINSLMYNIHTDELIDPTGMGISDLQNKIIRTIIDPNLKYRIHAPDMLRAIRFYATKPNFRFAPGMLEAMREHAIKVLPREKGGDISSRRIERELRKAAKNSSEWAKMKATLIEVGLDKYIGEQMEDVEDDIEGGIDYSLTKKTPKPSKTTQAQQQDKVIESLGNQDIPSWWDSKALRDNNSIYFISKTSMGGDSRPEAALKIVQEKVKSVASNILGGQAPAGFSIKENYWRKIVKDGKLLLEVGTIGSLPWQTLESVWEQNNIDKQERREYFEKNIPVKSSLRSFTKRAQEDVQISGPTVQIDPSIKQDVQSATDELVKMDPSFFKGVSKIVALTGSPFGQVASDDPTVIHLNLQKIKSDVQTQLGSKYQQSNPEHKKIFDEAIKRSIVETVSHERAHVLDFDPETGAFPGGEGVAEKAEQEALRRLNLDKPIEASLKRQSILIQKHNEKTNKKEWALVSKDNKDKILEWYGSKKPSKEEVGKTEKRVQYFKNKTSSIRPFTKLAIEEVSTIAVMNEDETEILMAPRKDSGKWTLPGGHVDEGETSTEGAIRELREETGLEVSRTELNHIGSDVVEKPSGEEVVVHSYKVINEDDTFTNLDPDNEVEEWKKIDVSEGLPSSIENNLHNEDNDVTLQFLGLQDKIEKNATDYAGRPMPNTDALPSHLTDSYPEEYYNYGREILEHKKLDREEKDKRLKDKSKVPKKK